MFEELVEAPERQSPRVWSISLSLAIQLSFLGLLVLLPLVYTQALPGKLRAVFVLAPSPPPSAPAVRRPLAATPRIIQPRRIEAPRVIPRRIPTGRVAAEPDFGNLDTSIPDRFPAIPGASGPDRSLENVPPLPRPPAPAGPLRVGGDVEQAKLIHEVRPHYPTIAKLAHLQGTVVLRARIDKEGRIEELQYVSGPALLLPAAMSAVRQWRYAPTLLNGEPVEVDTTVDVVFTLGRD